MAKIISTVPPIATRPAKVTISELLAVLPDVLPYTFDVYLGDRLARYGKTAHSITFLVDNAIEPNTEVRQYFETLVAPFGLPATASNAIKNRTLPVIRIYNQGRLIIDRETLTYTELPAPLNSSVELTIDEVVQKLPQTIPFTETIWLTGSLTEKGWSANDADFLVGTAEEKSGDVTFTSDTNKKRTNELKTFFKELLSWNVHVGTSIMRDREPVSLLKIYEGGEKCLPST